MMRIINYLETFLKTKKKALKIKLQIVALILVILTSCKTELDVSRVDSLLHESFQVHKTTYGGIIGESKISYKFSEGADSVDLHIIHHFMNPKEKFSIKIDKSTFQEIKTQIKCMASFSSDEEAKRAGCQPPFESEYLVTSNFSKIRIYPKNQDTCRFVYLIPEYEAIPDLLSPKG